MKKVLIAGLSALLLLPTLACGPEDDNSGPSAGNGGGIGFGDPNPGQQPPAPAADPGPQNDAGHAVFTLTWVGERGGYVTLNNSEEKIPVPRPTKEADGKFRGQWTQTIAVIPGQSYGFTWFPVADKMFAQRTVHHKGQIADYQHVQSGSCAVSFKA